MEVNATLETRQSKSGNNYEVIVIKLTPTYEKLVFLEKSEIELLKLSKTPITFPEFPLNQ